MKRCLLTCFAVLLCGLSMAQQLGEVYSTIYQPMGMPVKVNTGLVAQDSGIVIGGAFERVHERAINRLAKLKQDGTNDYSFDIGSGFNGEVNVVVEQPNGRLIVGGDFTQYNGSSCNRIVRLLSNGSRDTSFNIGTGFNNSVYDIELLGSGELVVAGSFTTYNSTTRQRVAKLNSNGSLYTSFGNVAVNNQVFCIAQDSSGQLVIGGSFTTVSGVSCTRIARLKSTGVLDTAYSTTTSGANNTVNEVMMQPGGEAIFAGYFTQFNGSTVNRIVRLTNTGTVDGTYSTGSGFGGAQVNEMVWQGDGKLLAIGHFTSYDGTTLGRVVRLNTNGTRDTTFSAGTGLDYSSNAIWLNHDGSLFVGGTFTTVNGFGRLGLAKLSSSGSLDKGFMKNSGADGPVLAFGTQSTGKTIVAGDFIRYNGDTVNRILRLNRDGSIDGSFSSGTGANNTINALLVQPDDKIILAGEFTAYNGTTKNRIVRLNSDGSIDSTYQSGSGANAAINEAKWASSGKLYIAGSFTSYNGTTRNRVCRLNSNGSLDAAFNAGTTFSITVYDIVEQPDGKVIGGGHYLPGHCSGTPCMILRRVDSTGAADNTFDAGTTTSSTAIEALLLQPDGKLLVNCYTSFNGIAASRMARLNTNGSVDTSFQGGANYTVKEFLKVDSVYLVGGAFTQVNSTSKMYLGSIKTNGQTDATFYTGDGMGYVYYLAGYCKRLYADEVNGRIWAGGVFSTAQGVVSNNMAVYRGTYGSAAAIDSAKMPGVVCRGNGVYARFKNTRYFNEGNVFTAELSDSSGSFASAKVIGSKTATGAPGWDSVWVSIADTVLPGSHYRIRIKTSNAVYVSAASGEFAVGVRDATVAGGGITSSKDTVCPNKKVSLYLSGYNGDIQWEKKDTANVWIRISGATNDTLHIDSFSVTTSYRVIVTKDYCSSDTSNVKTIYPNTSFDCIYEYNWYYLMVHTTDTNNIPTHPDSLLSRNSALNAILNEMQVIQFYKPFPNAKTAYLNDVYAINCNGDMDTLYQRIVDGEFFDYVEPTPYWVQTSCTNPVPYNDPVFINGFNTNWCLDMIEAECAWTITTGDANVVVAVVDGEFDVSHEDYNDPILGSKFVNVYGVNTDSTPSSHGTWVASVVGAYTNNSKGIASIGNEIKLAGYLTTTIGGFIINPYPGLWNASQNHERVISISAASLACPAGYADIVCSQPAQQEIMRLVVSEIVDNGALIIFDVPNTVTDVYDNLSYSSIPGVVVVGAVGLNNAHGGTGSHHNRTIDLCAPWGNMAVTNSTVVSSGGYVEVYGTSFATPMVAGTAGLILSLNNTLAPHEIEDILKCSTDPIADSGIYINASGESLIGTGRLNAYQACLLAQKSVTMQEVSSNTTWNSEKILWDVTVKSGATLTISSGSVIEMGANTKITVEPGAKLIVDNATITNSCAGMWGGIIVQGKVGEPQTIDGNGMSNQGYLVLENATIENAYEAVRLWNPSMPNLDLGSGGIVQAYGTTFRNNRRSVEFMEYHHIHPHTYLEIDNLSRFTDCEFVTDDNHHIQHPFHAHATVWGVRGLKFLGCRFKNERTDITNATTNVQLGNGIVTIDAGITVDDYVYGNTPSGVAFKRSEFKNLNHGVYVANQNGPYTAIVNHAKFTNCLRGIRNEGVNLCRFTGNEFVLGGNAATDYSTPFSEGIMLHQATGFTVEQNTFTNAASPAHLTIGIRADGTGAADNRIYHNTFTNVHAGNVANRQNTNGSSQFPDGLRYECNQNESNAAYDICVANPTPQQLYGIRSLQNGTGNNVAAGNTFTHDNSVVAESDFYNSELGLIYHYFNTNDKPQYYTPIKVDPQSPIGLGLNTCNANYTFPTEGNPNGGGCSTCLTFNDYSAEYSTHKAAQTNFKAQYLALIDGGNTEARKLMTDTVSNGSRLRDSLLAYLPNLSSEVLDKAARRGILNDTMKYEVMRQNAEGITAEIYEYLRDRVNLPQWMLDTIQGAKQNLTLRSYVLDTLLYHTEQREQANYAVLRLVQEDTAGFNLTTYREWLDSSDGVWAKQEIVNTYLHEARYDTIATLLAHYDTLIQKIDSAAFKNYREYATAYASWMLADSSIMRLDSTHLAVLKTIAATNEHKQGANMARNILNFFYDSVYFTPAYLPEQQFNKKGNEETTEPVAQQQQSKKEQPTVKLYPNPASNTITIEYKAVGKSSKLFITDALGVLYEMKELRGEQGKEIVNVSNYTNGIYLARIVTDDADLLKNKFVILK